MKTYSSTPRIMRCDFCAYSSRLFPKLLSFLALSAMASVVSGVDGAKLRCVSDLLSWVQIMCSCFCNDMQKYKDILKYFLSLTCHGVCILRVDPFAWYTLKLEMCLQSKVSDLPREHSAFGPMPQVFFLISCRIWNKWVLIFFLKSLFFCLHWWLWVVTFKTTVF